MVREILGKYVGEAQFRKAVGEVVNLRGYSLENDKINTGANTYLIKAENLFHHQYGSGGYSLAKIVLTKKTDGESDEKNVLESKHYISWDTYSDDSEDHENKELREDFLVLYDCDSFGREVAEIIIK
jgi:hypothetical protein